MSIKKFSMMLLSAMAMAAFLSGCGTSSKEGTTAAGAGFATVAKVDETQCRVCHATSPDPTGANILQKFLASPHNRPDAGCQGCHGGGSQHNGVGPLPYMAATASESCKECHDGATVTTGTNVGNSPAPGAAKTTAKTTYTITFGGDPVTAARHTGAGGFLAKAGGSGKCGSCHGAHAPLAEFVMSTSVDCLTCHDIGQNKNEFGQAIGKTFVNDNNGVRAIKAEFDRTSHHVTGRAVTSADCAVCHLEGKKTSAGIIIDTKYHMVDAKTHLRNGGGVSEYADAEFAWDPATPDHSTMDKFCMSCHNSNGAPNAVGIVTGNSAINPFNSGLTNSYDTLVRPAVVPVYEQFDTNNVAHHAVRGAKYATRSRATATAANAAKFTQYSSPTNPGSRKTIFDAGLFVATYIPLGDNQSVADNSVIHCGDCHTVGQFKPGSTTNAAGVPITAAQVVGAHGSNNEYLLRNASGDDVLHHQSNNASATAGPVDGTYVCFICHAQTADETGGYNAMGFHASMEGANTSYCNGRAAESVGLTGFGGTFKTTYDANGVKTGQTRVPNIIGTNSGGTVFGYSCSHCHNSGQNNTFGGIHGGNATYKSYSGVGTTTSIVNKKPYRFMGGLSLRYNGGADAARWESNAKFTTARREGCYNQSTVANTATKIKVWGPATWTDANGVTDTAAVQPDGANGTWGSCSHHNGVTTSGSGTQPTRIGVTRPLSY